MDIRETLKTLCIPPGVAGAENTASEAAKVLLCEYIPDVKIDSFGNVTGSIIHDEKLPLLLLDAHIDEVGMVVSFIDDNGFIKVGRAGGTDRRGLPGAQVTVWGKKPLKGIICVLPPHVSKDENKVIKEDEIAIDCGMTKEEITQMISLGDSITVNAEFCELLNGNITARALDNRAGVCAILYALDLIKDRSTKYNLAVLFSAQEEIGCRGAGIAAFNIEPDLAIAVDVSYGNYPGGAENKMWKLGGGVMIGCAPTLDRTLFQDMKDIANAGNIPFQIEVMSGKTRTNADVIGVTKSGVKCALLSVPLRNMHTVAEVVNVSDIEAAGQLIARFVTGGNDV